MAFSFDDDARTRTLSRTGAVLSLRDPAAIYGFCAFVLQLSVGTVVMLWTASGSEGFTASDAQVVAFTAFLASTITTATVGSALYQNAFSSAFALVLRTTLIWAALAALWPLTTLAPEILPHPGAVDSIEDLTKPVIAQGERMLISAFEGALGGGAAALLVSMLCIERRD